MEFQSVQYSVDKLIQWIRTGRLALPDFQRDFVWNPSRVVELLDSVAKQWPIGSLLLLSGPQPFGVRAIESAPPVGDSDLDLYVLDGQQRLTSLFHAVNDVSDFCYFVDFKLLSQGGDDYIQWNRRPVFLRQFGSVGARANARIALISDLWELDNFYTWLEQIDDPSAQRMFVRLRETELAGLQAKVYKVMGIQLDQKIKLEALARIFETLNRTGVKLNAFDLIVAIMYPTGFHLRDEWEAARDRSDLINYFEVDPLELLKLVALLIRGDVGRNESKGVRQGDLLQLDKQLIRRAWAPAVLLYEQALSYSRNELGVFCSEVVPSWAMILGIASWLHFGRRDGLDDRALHAWFWGSAFTQTYSQGANTKIVSDFDQVSQGRGGDLARDRYTGDFSIFDQPAKRNGLAMKAFACLLASSGALDPISGRPLREATSVAFRCIQENRLLKVGAHDTFSRLVVLSGESDRFLTKAQHNLFACGVSDEQLFERFQSQFIDPIFLERGPGEYAQMLGRVIPGGLQ